MCRTMQQPALVHMQDYAAEAEEARRVVEEVEGQAAQQAEADNQEKASLR